MDFECVSDDSAASGFRSGWRWRYPKGLPPASLRHWRELSGDWRKLISASWLFIENCLAFISDCLFCVAAFADGFNPIFVPHFRQIIG